VSLRQSRLVSSALWRRPNAWLPRFEFGPSARAFREPLARLEDKMAPNNALVTDACATALLCRASFGAAQRGR